VTLPAPTTRFTLLYDGPDDLPSGVPREAEWMPEWTAEDIAAERCYRLFDWKPGPLWPVE
jgi:hypothetical protein